MAERVIDIKGVYFSYGKHWVLEDINFQVNEGDFIGIIGPNGGGKTTLIKVILGLVKPQKGQVFIRGYPVEKGRKFIGYVPQAIEFDRAFPISVQDVVRMGRLSQNRILKPYNQKDEKIVQECLEKVEMWHLRHHCIGELSGGERQRVYIARALATKPHILLLDEPTANVDSKVQNNIYELLQQLNEHITILLVSHDLGAISRHVKTIACLNRRLYYHGDKLITPEMLEATYNCPIDLIAHGIPHRVFPPHQ